MHVRPRPEQQLAVVVQGPPWLEQPPPASAGPASAQQADLGMPQLSVQFIVELQPVGAQHWSVAVLHSRPPSHEQPVNPPQSLLTDVLHWLPQLSTGWHSHTLPTHEEPPGHPPQDTCWPQLFWTVVSHWLPHAADVLSGEQHALCQQTAPDAQPGQVIGCPQLLVNEPPQAYVVWQRLLSGVQHVAELPLPMHSVPVLAPGHWPSLPQ